MHDSLEICRVKPHSSAAAGAERGKIRGKYVGPKMSFFPRKTLKSRPVFSPRISQAFIFSQEQAKALQNYVDPALV
jgi:hypothetical protein